MNKLTFIIFFSISFMDVFDGYTLFTPAISSDEAQTTFFIDNDENIINTWSHTRLPASMPYLLSDSSIVYPYLVENPTMEAGGVGGGVQCLSWRGEILWDYTFSDSLYQHHHDVEPLPNGNILIIVWEKKSVYEAIEMGRTDIEEWSFNEMWSTAILELNPLSQEIVWEWHLWDHLVQDISPEYGATYGEISNHPELFDINCGPVGSSSGGPVNNSGDWIHINAIDYNPILDQIVLSSRIQNEIYIIDHSTTTEQAASHSGGNSGKGGDILYRWGNPQNYGIGSSSDQILSAPHSVNWIPDGYPGSGNLILFNNFHIPGHSAVLEIIPPIENGNYIINENNSFGPQNIDWEYICDITVPMQGGSFRLPNGNTIITLTHIGQIVEVDQSGNIVWSYEHEASSEGGISSAWIARADKYSLDYLAYNILGDINSDNIINILDIVIMINIILANQYEPNADMNSDGTLDILDVVVIINILIE